MDLNDLATSLSDLSDAELLLLLKDIRQNRRVSKREPTQRKPSVKKEQPAPDLATLLSSMSAEQRAELLKKLGG